MFAGFQRLLDKKPLENFDLENLGQGHEVHFSQCRHSKLIVTISKCRLFTFFYIFAKVRPALTKITDIHKNGQAHSYRRNLADFPKNLSQRAKITVD